MKYNYCMNNINYMRAGVARELFRVTCKRPDIEKGSPLDAAETTVLSLTQSWRHAPSFGEFVDFNNISILEEEL